MFVHALTGVTNWSYLIYCHHYSWIGQSGKVEVHTVCLHTNLTKLQALAIISLHLLELHIFGINSSPVPVMKFSKFSLLWYNHFIDVAHEVCVAMLCSWHPFTNNSKCFMILWTPVFVVWIISIQHTSESSIMGCPGQLVNFFSKKIHNFELPL